MKTEDRGILKIDIHDNNILQVVFDPVNFTVWLYEWELPALFGVGIPTIRACMDSVCKDIRSDVEKFCKYDLFVRGQHVRYDIKEVRLEIIIAMAFRIDSANAKCLREWFIRRCLHHGIDITVPLSDVSDNCLN